MAFCFTHAPGIAWDEFDGEAVLVDLAQGRVWTLNPTATYIWRQCRNGARPEQIAGALANAAQDDATLKTESAAAQPETKAVQTKTKALRAETTAVPPVTGAERVKNAAVQTKNAALNAAAQRETKTERAQNEAVLAETAAFLAELETQGLLQKHAPRASVVEAPATKSAKPPKLPYLAPKILREETLARPHPPINPNSVSKLPP
ncbi:MAG: PqqD family peptide modification chaperone [Planctomycetes bacterium]|nr:PqqD family peptide modification chaperone [Planctomycetota bacterium]